MQQRKLATLVFVLVSSPALAFVAACNNAKTDAAPAQTAKPTATAATSADEIPAIQVNSAPPQQAAPAAIPAPPDVAAAPADAQKTASGLVSKVLAKGTGTKHPSGSDKVKVNYTGWTVDGKMFDSSVARGEPITFPLDGVIPGWTEGVALMVVGEKRRLWIPAALAYGDKPHGGAPSGPLTFDVELIDIAAAPKPPPVPEDLKAPPASAKKTESGLAYRLLSAGKDPTSPHPQPTDVVRVNYSGWTTDGKMFDSSVTRGEPVAFPLNGVIPGWTEGVQLMRVGDKMRFWIPAKLAYGDKPKPGAPAGTLVFDIELLDMHAGRPMPPRPAP